MIYFCLRDRRPTRVMRTAILVPYTTLVRSEIKSGYGLNLEDEMKMLRVARRLGESEPVTVKTTYLGAHDLPPEFDRRPKNYIDSVVAQRPQVLGCGHVDSDDDFCERIAYEPQQVARVLERTEQQTAELQSINRLSY